MNNLSRVALCIVCFSIIACNRQATTGSKGSQMDKTTEIKWGELIKYPSEDLTITFNSVKDNRCPSTVKCIVAGEGKVALTISKGKQTQNLTLIAKGLCQSEDGSCGQEKNALGYTIQLLNLYPYPEKASVSEESTYVKLIVRKGESLKETR